MTLWKERTIRLPTLQGCLLLAVLLLGTGYGLLRTLHPFFAVTDRLPAPHLVVEGWGADFLMEQAAAEATNGGYRHIFVTGGPMQRSADLPGYDSFAEVGYGALKRLGVPPHQLTAVPSWERYRNRTYSAAVALREYARTNGIELKVVNVLTLDVHSRRSRLAFQRALGRDVQVGVIAIGPREYDPKRWWRYSEGVKSMISELIALPYAWLSLDYGN